MKTMTVSSSSRLQHNHVCSTSPIPSFASWSSRPSSRSIADIDTTSPSDSTARPQDIFLKDNSSTSFIAANAASLTSRPLRTSPFKSFPSLELSVPFNNPRGSGQLHIITSISIAFLYQSAVAVANVPMSHSSRQLADEWTGKWDGEWTAPQGDDYVYECGDGCNSDSGSDKSMWIENDAAALTPDQIITYVSIGILSFMMLLCCVCYPEIVVVGYAKLFGCFGRGKGDTGVSTNGDEDNMESKYLGGMQERGDKRKKKRNVVRKRDVELV